MSATDREIASQPEMWRRAAEMSAQVAQMLPIHGERVAVVGCGTSWFMAQAYASLREPVGETDAFTASEFPTGRRYDRVIAISRSGTTTEVATLLRDLTAPVTAITAVPGTPVADAASSTIVLDFADESSVVQTRFATSVLALLRASLGEDLGPVADEAATVIVDPLPVDPAEHDHYVSLGVGWTIGLANEAALKLREAAQAWSEAYPAMEFRHGPISVVRPGTVVWALGPVDRGVLQAAQHAGAAVVTSVLDPMVELVRIQRTAVALAHARSLDPDRPRNLTRSVVLTGETHARSTGG